MTSPNLIPNIHGEQGISVGHLLPKSGHNPNMAVTGPFSRAPQVIAIEAILPRVRGIHITRNRRRQPIKGGGIHLPTNPTIDNSNQPPPAARLSAVQFSSHTKPVTAFSHDPSSHYRKYSNPGKKKPSYASKPAKSQWQDKSKQKRQPRSRDETPLKDGEVRLNFTDTTQEYWEKKIKFALHHKHRMRALKMPGQNLLPRPTNPTKARLAANILTGAGLLDTVDMSQAEVVNLTATCNQALIIPVPEISRFEMPEPLHSKAKTATPGRWFMAHRSLLLNASCWRVSYVRLIGPITRTTNYVSYQPSEHTLWEWRLVDATPFLTTQLLTCWTVLQRREKDNNRCSSEPSIEGKWLT